MSDNSNSNKKYFILISAGGTGGHMSPAAALAHDLLSRGYRVELATDVRGAKYASMFNIPEFDDINLHIIKSGTSFAGIIGKLKGALNLGLGILHAFRLVKSLKPDLVIGFGGYPSVPAVFAAQRLKIPTILHEQNAIIGKANAFLAPRAERIALSMPYVSGLDSQDDQFRCVITGNPVRAQVAYYADSPYPELSDNGQMRIFIMGGSLGASVFSKIIPNALSQLDDTNFDSLAEEKPSPSNGEPHDNTKPRQRLKIIQQCRAADIDEVQEIYQNAGIDATTAIFFDDVAGELSKAHLFIGRSGASTVAEVSVVGVPAIYVPYPHHKDQQQKMNALNVANKGGAWVVEEKDFDIDLVQQKIIQFLQDPSILSQAALHAKSCGKADAAKKLGNLVNAIVADNR